MARAVEQSAELVPRIIELGAEPVIMPAIEIKPPEEWTAVDGASIASRNSTGSSSPVRTASPACWAVYGTWEAMFAGWAAPRLAAIGEEQPGPLSGFRLRATWFPSRFEPKRWLRRRRRMSRGSGSSRRGRVGDDVLPTELHRARARLEEVVVYRNLDVETIPGLCSG